MFLKGIVLVLVLCLGQGGALRLQDSGTRLPSERSGAAAVYDGDHFIYILGGQNINASNHLDEIVRYDLDTDSVQVVARFEYPVGVGSAVATDDGLVYFGGVSLHTGYTANISFFSPDSNNVSFIGQLPQPLNGAASVWDPVDQVAYTLGGYNGEYQDAIYKYNANTDEVGYVGQLLGNREFPGAVWDDTRRVVYIFGGYGSAGSHGDILVYNPLSGTVIRLGATLPYHVVHSCAVGAGGDSYIIGSRSLIRFNHESHDVEEVEVEMWREMRYTGSVYVPKLNRIYIFGGIRDSVSGLGSDLISYVQFSDESPDPDCSGGETRLVPDRFCCANFYMCQAGEATKYECPDDKHFSPDTLSCENKGEVGCEITYKATKHS